MDQGSDGTSSFCSLYRRGKHVRVPPRRFRPLRAGEVIESRRIFALNQQDEVLLGASKRRIKEFFRSTGAYAGQNDKDNAKLTTLSLVLPTHKPTQAVHRRRQTHSGEIRNEHLVSLSVLC